tara:strand:- start:1355 stop:2302 length:948 start_codon:yes stop_codon:yes gene_type:complete
MEEEQIRETDIEIDLKKVLSTILDGKIFIILIVFLSSLASVFYALSLPNIYIATSDLTFQKDDNEDQLSASSGLSGLFNFAGLSSGGTDKEIIFATMNSQKFISHFINKRKILPQILALESWDALNDKITFNKNLYDPSTKKWNDETDQKELMFEAYEVFTGSHLLISKPNKDIFSLSIKSYSPEVSALWAKWIIEDLNTFFKNEDEVEALKSIEYLSNQIENTNNIELRKIFYSIIESKTRDLMLIEIKDEYTIKTIDPAQNNNIRVSPRRSFIVIVTAFIASIFSIFSLLVLNFLKYKINIIGRFPFIILRKI